MGDNPVYIGKLTKNQIIELYVETKRELEAMKLTHIPKAEVAQLCQERFEDGKRVVSLQMAQQLRELIKKCNAKDIEEYARWSVARKSLKFLIKELEGGNRE